MVRSIIINDDIAHNYFISRDDDGTYRLPIAIHPNKIHLPKTSQQVNEFVGKSDESDWSDKSDCGWREHRLNPLKSIITDFL